MNDAPEYKFRKVQENVHYHFNFLLDRGFRIVSIIFVDKAMEYWVVIMASNECLIKIYNYQGEIRLGISAMQLFQEAGFFDLEELAYLASRGERYPGRYLTSPLGEEQQFERLASLLRGYIDRVTFLPGENLYADGEELRKALLQIRSAMTNENMPEKIWFYFQDLLHES